MKTASQMIKQFIDDETFVCIDDTEKLMKWYAIQAFGEAVEKATVVISEDLGLHDYIGTKKIIDAILDVKNQLK